MGFQPACEPTWAAKHGTQKNEHRPGKGVKIIRNFTEIFTCRRKTRNYATKQNHTKQSKATPTANHANIELTTWNTLLTAATQIRPLCDDAGREWFLFLFHCVSKKENGSCHQLQTQENCHQTLGVRRERPQCHNCGKLVQFRPIRYRQAHNFSNRQLW